MNKGKMIQPHWINNLRALMDAQGTNPRALSLKAGLNATAVRDMLEGRTKFPRYDTVQALATALATTPAQLMGGTEPKENKGKTKETIGDLDLLTEIITRLQEATEEYRRTIKPHDFAAMVAAIYRQMNGHPSTKKSLATIRPKVIDLMEYDNLRKHSTGN